MKYLTEFVNWINDIDKDSLMLDNSDESSTSVTELHDEQDLEEADNPNYFGGGSQSAIPGTPSDLLPQPDPSELRRYQRELKSLKRFMGR